MSIRDKILKLRLKLNKDGVPLEGRKLYIDSDTEEQFFGEHLMLSNQVSLYGFDIVFVDEPDAYQLPK